MMVAGRIKPIKRQMRLLSGAHYRNKLLYVMLISAATYLLEQGSALWRFIRTKENSTCLMEDFASV